MKNISSATSIKCRFSNEVHKILEPNYNVEKQKRWKYRKNFTDKEKLELFDKIFELHNRISSEYTKCLYERRNKRRVQKARIERGYVPKKKTKKSEYMKMV